MYMFKKMYHNTSIRNIATWNITHSAWQNNESSDFKNNQIFISQIWICLIFDKYYFQKFYVNKIATE